MTVTRRATFMLLLLIAATLPAFGQVGRDWGVERRSYQDPVSGVRIDELATVGVNDNLYFHFSNFTADNRYLIFSSTRTGTPQFYRAEVSTGRIVQLTDSPGGTLRGICPDRTRADRVYLIRKDEVIALNILDFSERRVATIPPPFIGGFQQPTQSGDGQSLTITKQVDERTWEIGLLDVRRGEYRTVIRQGFRIGHVQHSPTDPLIFYVWETGGYAPQRTWVVNSDGSGNRPFYARTDPKSWFTPLKEWITHEAWVEKTGEMTMINDKQGVMLVDKAGVARMVIEGDYWHVAARPDGRFMVIDDNKGRLWLLETATGNRRLLATGLRDTVRAVHAHASFDREGHYVQFHTGRTQETIAIIDLRELPGLKWQ
jgi:oligogalacturonide lyase